MIAARASAVVKLAREIADILPFPPGDLLSDPVAYHEWEQVMLQAAHGLAMKAEYDCDVLYAAIGPKLEVGANPVWRVLLMIALQEARVYREAHPAAPANQPTRSPPERCCVSIDN
jgi:hypothetical protein